jgi:hypothetical protein
MKDMLYPKDIWFYFKTLNQYCSIDSPQEIKDFLIKKDSKLLMDTLLHAVIEIKKEPKSSKIVVSFFESPIDEGDAIYVNADFNINNYESVYGIETKIFDKVIKPKFKELKFQILLSFDNI